MFSAAAIVDSERAGGDTAHRHAQFDSLATVSRSTSAVSVSFTPTGVVNSVLPAAVFHSGQSSFPRSSASRQSSPSPHAFSTAPINLASTSSPALDDEVSIAAAASGQSSSTTAVQQRKTILHRLGIVQSPSSSPPLAISSSAGGPELHPRKQFTVHPASAPPTDEDGNVLQHHMSGQQQVVRINLIHKPINEEAAPPQHPSAAEGRADDGGGSGMKNLQCVLCKTVYASHPTSIAEQQRMWEEHITSSAHQEILAAGKATSRDATSDMDSLLRTNGSTGTTSGKQFDGRPPVAASSSSSSSAQHELHAKKQPQPMGHNQISSIRDGSHSSTETNITPPLPSSSLNSKNSPPERTEGSGAHASHRHRDQHLLEVLVKKREMDLASKKQFQRVQLEQLLQCRQRKLKQQLFLHWHGRWFRHLVVLQREVKSVLLNSAPMLMQRAVGGTDRTSEGTTVKRLQKDDDETRTKRRGAKSAAHSLRLEEADNASHKRQKSPDTNKNKNNYRQRQQKEENERREDPVHAGPSHSHSGHIYTTRLRPQAAEQQHSNNRSNGGKMTSKDDVIFMNVIETSHEDQQQQEKLAAGARSSPASSHVVSWHVICSPDSLQRRVKEGGSRKELGTRRSGERTKKSRSSSSSSMDSIDRVVSKLSTETQRRVLKVLGRPAPPRPSVSVKDDVQKGLSTLPRAGDHGAAMECPCCGGVSTFPAVEPWAPPAHDHLHSSPTPRPASTSTKHQVHHRVSSSQQALCDVCERRGVWSRREKNGREFSGRSSKPVEGDAGGAAGLAADDGLVVPCGADVRKKEVLLRKLLKQVLWQELPSDRQAENWSKYDDAVRRSIAQLEGLRSQLPL